MFVCAWGNGDNTFASRTRVSNPPIHRCDVPEHTSEKPFLSIPRHQRLQVRAIVAIMCLVSVMVGSSTWILAQVFGHRMDQVIDQDTIQMTEALSDRFGVILDPSYEPEMHPDGDLAARRRRVALEIIEARRDPRIGFILVETPAGESFAEAIIRADLWQRYMEMANRAPMDFELQLSRPAALPLPQAPEARALRRPIFTPGQRTLAGYLIVGTVDPSHRATIGILRAAAIGIVCISCLVSIPLTVFVIRRLARPIVRIAMATVTLANGDVPDQLEIHRDDEIGALARAFNDMSAKLIAAQEHQRQENHRLDAQVKQRTKELTRVNDVLAREIEDKNQLLRTVSHDLNAPLRNISGMVEMIRRKHTDDLPEDVHTRLDRISANVRMETDMIQDLLELSRLRTREYKASEVDLSETISRVFDALAHEIDERDIECSVDPDIPRINADPQIVRQVFLNLIDNAVKYMGDPEERSGPAQIDVRYAVTPTDLLVSVRDTGPGLSETDLDKIFQVFNRGASATRRGIDGRGIGLANVRAAAARWGGTVTATSVLGEGSTFLVTVPLSQCIRNDSAGAREHGNDDLRSDSLA